MRFRSPLLITAIPLLAALAFGQDPPANPQTPQQPATQQQSKDSTAAMSPDTGKTHDSEMKTQGYSGTLMDASCAMGSTGSSTATPGAAPKENTATPSKGADRSVGGDQSQSCSVSASTTQFALKTNDGRTLKFDNVGNERATEALKNKKKWTDASAAGKPIHVKTTGVLMGDQLTVLSIN